MSWVNSEYELRFHSCCPPQKETSLLTPFLKASLSGSKLGALFNSTPKASSFAVVFLSSRVTWPSTLLHHLHVCITSPCLHSRTLDRAFSARRGSKQPVHHDVCQSFLFGRHGSAPRQILNAAPFAAKCRLEFDPVPASPFLICHLTSQHIHKRYSPTSCSAFPEQHYLRCGNHLNVGKTAPLRAPRFPL